MLLLAVLAVLLMSVLAVLLMSVLAVLMMSVLAVLLAVQRAPLKGGEALNPSGFRLAGIRRVPHICTGKPVQADGHRSEGRAGSFF